MAFCNEGPFRPPVKEGTITVLKYSYALSNKEFKRRWVKTHGTSAGLKDLPRFAVKQRSIRAFGLEYWFRMVRDQEKLLEKLRKRLVHTGHLPTSTRGPSKGPVPDEGTRKQAVRPKARDRLAKVHRRGGDTLKDNLGGLVTFNGNVPPPNQRWVKYCYYYRKRGYWQPSEHHPYGDENVYIKYTESDRGRPG